MRHFILVVYREQHLCLCTNTCPFVNQGQTSEMYMMVYVDKNTLHLPFKIKDTIENKIRSMQTRTYSLKPKIYLKISIAVKGQIHVNLSKLK